MVLTFRNREKGRADEHPANLVQLKNKGGRVARGLVGLVIHFSTRLDRYNKYAHCQYLLKEAEKVNYQGDRLIWRQRTMEETAPSEPTQPSEPK